MSGHVVRIRALGDELGADRNQHAVMASLTGLSPDTIYHARLIAVNTVGRRTGEDIAFTTSMPPRAL